MSLQLCAEDSSVCSKVALSETRTEVLAQEDACKEGSQFVSPVFPFYVCMKESITKTIFNPD